METIQAEYRKQNYVVPTAVSCDQTVGEIHSAKKNLYSVQNLRFPVISDILGLDEGRSSYGQNKNIY